MKEPFATRLRELMKNVEAARDKHQQEAIPVPRPERCGEKRVFSGQEELEPCKGTPRRSCSPKVKARPGESNEQIP